MRIVTLVLIAFLLCIVAGCGSARRLDGGVGMLKEGSGVPDLRTEDHQGKSVDLHTLAKDHQVLVYFYPKDSTPGCTKEACALRDAWQKFLDADVVVLGVSADSAKSHRKFAAQHHLPFSLIADGEGKWADAFGVSKTLGFYSRVSFLVGKGGVISKVYRGVDPAQHANQVLLDAAQPQRVAP